MCMMFRCPHIFWNRWHELSLKYYTQWNWTLFGSSSPDDIRPLGWWIHWNFSTGFHEHSLAYLDHPTINVHSVLFERYKTIKFMCYNEIRLNWFTKKKYLPDKNVTQWNVFHIPIDYWWSNFPINLHHSRFEGCIQVYSRQPMCMGANTHFSHTICFSVEI